MRASGVARVLMRYLFGCAFAVITAVAVHGQRPELVSAASPGWFHSSVPADMASNGRVVFFTALDSNGRELWTTDGTRAGTRMVVDLTPGDSTFTDFTQVLLSGDQAYVWTRSRGGRLWSTRGTAETTESLIDDAVSIHFTGVPFGDHSLIYSDSFQLWISDGTRDGTTAISDIGGDLLTRAGETVFFARPRALWKTDGTARGTVVVSAFEEAGVVALADAAGLIVAATTGSFDDSSAVWFSDGTAAGTHRVLESPLRFAMKPVAIGRTVFFAFDGENGFAELWKSDGTAGGTLKVAELPVESQWLRAAAVDGQRLLFTALTSANFTDLWESDGTAAGTRVLVSFANSSDVAVTVAGDQIFFLVSGMSRALYAMRRGERPVKLASHLSHGLALATLGDHVVAGIDDNAHGHELWTSDGTVAGTRLLANIAADGVNGVLPRRFGQTQILYNAFEASSGFEPWISDGSTSGTHILTDVSPGTESSYASLFSDLGNGRAVFIASDPAHGRELWVTDGTAAGTQRVTDVVPGPRDSLPEFSGSSEFAVLDHRALFATWQSVWITDGTAAGTHSLAELEPHYGSSILVTNELAFISSRTGLWRTDGTPAGTIQLSPHVELMHVAGGRLYFTSRSEATGSELWVTDGSPMGTHLVRDINPGPADAFTAETGTWFAGVNGTLMFAADDGVHGSEIWATDGTTEGTRLVRDVNPGPGGSTVWGYNPPGEASVGGVVLFRADDGKHGIEVWRSDGSAEGTSLLTDIAPGTASSNAGAFVSALGRVYFAADDGIHGQELWSSDGTAAGTSLLSDVQAGPWASWPRDIVPVGRSLLFFAATEETGLALWRLTPPAVHRRAVQR